MQIGDLSLDPAPWGLILTTAVALGPFGLTSNGVEVPELWKVELSGVLGIVSWGLTIFGVVAPAPQRLTLLIGVLGSAT